MNGDIFIKIPLSLLTQVIYVLEHIDISVYDRALQSDYDDAIFALNNKKARFDLREDYAQIIHAKDDNSRLWARMRYLEHKREIVGDC